MEVSADDHDLLVDAPCDMVEHGLTPSALALAERTGLPQATCAAWISGDRKWPPNVDNRKSL